MWRVGRPVRSTRRTPSRGMLGGTGSLGCLLVTATWPLFTGAASTGTDVAAEASLLAWKRYSIELLGIAHGADADGSPTTLSVSRRRNIPDVSRRFPTCERREQ